MTPLSVTPPSVTPLSIIVPFYNETAYLRSALNSILSQRIDGLQIIVVNDNPETYSADDLAAHGVSCPVELIQHPRNLGLSAARNSGMKQARGRFIGFLDSDDYYTLGGLASQLQQALDTDADITHAPTYFTQKGSSDTRVLPRDLAFFSQLKTAKGLLGAEEAQFITSSWSSLYARDFLTRNALTFDPEQTRFEDRLFVLHTVTRARKIAFTGTPSRVWRGREGSISVSTTSSDIHLLQIQLLEKCMAHIRAEVASGALPPRFEKRELFNTVSRLIWDLDVIEAITTRQDTADPDATAIYDDIARRIPPLLGTDSFSHHIFGDKILQPVNRVGMKTRKGRVTRTAFYAIHNALRQGDIPGAHALLAECRDTPPQPAPAPARPASPMVSSLMAKLGRPKLLLHLGLHKTGSTYIQSHLQTHRTQLLKAGILVPLTGFSDLDTPLRDGATPGHQGLVSALRQGDGAPWAALQKEIKRSRADTVLLSCENMGFPTLPDRDHWIDALTEKLGMFSQTHIVALIRRPDAHAEAFYRERIANGARLGTAGLSGGIDAFLNDHAAALTNLPDLFGPFESRLSTQARLADFDQLRGNGLWPGFVKLAGLPNDLPVLDVPRYPTPDRDAILLLQLLNTLIPDADLRADLLQAWFSLHPTPAPDDSSLLSPTARLTLLDRWQETSADFAATRGYAPDLTAARTALKTENWSPPAAIPVAKLNDLIGLAAQAAGPLFSTTTPTRPAQHRATPSGGMSLTIRLRPWLANLLRKARR
ncbi:MAG: hypothetical protein ACI8R4_002171 [Paracoccaceae bacterium]|jgi:hypothetical protein